MTKPLDKTTVTRLAWITELRRQGHRQCQGAYFKSQRRVCALGLLLEIAVPTGDIPNPFWDRQENVGALAGLDNRQSFEIVNMNDGCSGRKHTFAEIADAVGDWFK